MQLGSAFQHQTARNILFTRNVYVYVHEAACPGPSWGRGRLLHQVVGSPNLTRGVLNFQNLLSMASFANGN